MPTNSSPEITTVHNPHSDLCNSLRAIGHPKADIAASLIETQDATIASHQIVFKQVTDAHMGENVDGCGMTDAQCAAIEKLLTIPQEDFRAAIDEYEDLKRDAELWRKHKASYDVLLKILDVASPLVLNKLKAIDAVADAGRAS